MRFFIMGGGCYGTFYARQLLRAHAAGALAVDEVAAVDRAEAPQVERELGGEPRLRVIRSDWEDFLDAHLAGPDALRPDDQLVTPPFTPHLALAWLLRALPREWPEWEWGLEPFRRFPGTPFQHQSEGGPLLVSHADWVCPVNCIEPERCPKTHGPRYWDLDRTVHEFAEALDAGGQPVESVHLFLCHHLAFGVGAYPLAALDRARRSIAAALERVGARPGREDEMRRFLVGTVSHCHGALHLLTAGRGMLSVSAEPRRPAARSRSMSDAPSDA